MDFKGENTKVPKRWLDADKMPFGHLLYMKFRRKGCGELQFLLKKSAVVGFDVKCQLCKKLIKAGDLREHFRSMKHAKKMRDVAELYFNQMEMITQLMARCYAPQTARSQRPDATSMFEEVANSGEQCFAEAIDNSETSPMLAKRRDITKLTSNIREKQDDTRLLKPFNAILTDFCRNNLSHVKSYDIGSQWIIILISVNDNFVWCLHKEDIIKTCFTNEKNLNNVEVNAEYCCSLVSLHASISAQINFQFIYSGNYILRTNFTEETKHNECSLKNRRYKNKDMEILDPKINIINLYFDFLPHIFLYKKALYDEWKHEQAKIYEINEDLPVLSDTELNSRKKLGKFNAVEKQIDVFPAIHNELQPLKNQETLNEPGTAANALKLQITATNDPNKVYSMLKISDLSKIQYRTTNAQKFCSMFKEKKNSLFCCLCDIVMGTKHNAFYHMLGKNHKKITNRKVIELSHPSYFTVQSINGNMYEAFEDLLKNLSHQQSYVEGVNSIFSSAEKRLLKDEKNSNQMENLEFVGKAEDQNSIQKFLSECGNMKIEEIRKIQCSSDDGKLFNMIDKNENYYICNICGQLPMKKSKSLRNHLLSDTHLENLKNVNLFHHTEYETIVESFCEDKTCRSETNFAISEDIDCCSKMGSENLVVEISVDTDDLVATPFNKESDLSMRTSEKTALHQHHSINSPSGFGFTTKPGKNILQHPSDAHLQKLPNHDSANSNKIESDLCSTSERNDVTNEFDIFFTANKKAICSIKRTLSLEEFKLKYINLHSNEIIKIEYKKGPSSDWDLMFQEKAEKYYCNICWKTRFNKASVISHLNSPFHIQNMNSVEALYHPQYYLLKENSTCLNNEEKGDSCDAEEKKRFEEFKLKYADMELDDILKVQFKTQTNTWQYMIQRERIRYLCVLCWRISIRTKDDISSHIRTRFHCENMKLVTAFHHPVYFPSKDDFYYIKQTVVPKHNEVSSDKKITPQTTKYDERENTLNVNPVENEHINRRNVTTDDNRASQIVNGILKLISDHDQKCKNPRCDIDCAQADIKEKENLLDDYLICDAMENRTEEIVDELEMKKRNQMKVNHSIKESNTRSQPAIENINNNLSKSNEEKNSIIVQGSDLNYTKPINRSPLKPKNACNVSSALLSDSKIVKKCSLPEINNENVSPLNKENALRVLRHVSALEYVLGSLGPLSTELLRKTLKNCTKGSAFAFSTEDILLLETIQEKLLGLIEIDVLSVKEFTAAKQVLNEIGTFVDYYK